MAQGRNFWPVYLDYVREEGPEYLGIRDEEDPELPTFEKGARRTGSGRCVPGHGSPAKLACHW